MNVDPCRVCGSKELNLVDGYYYCVECGTQDEEVRETMVDMEKLVFDRKIKKVNTVKEVEEVYLPNEWCKWHALNFMLSNLVDELIALGAEPSFKLKALWIWTKYIQKFQNREAMKCTGSEESDTKLIEDRKESSEDSDDENKKRKRSKICFKDYESIKKPCNSILFAILYIALNLDRSDIQLSHFIRFTKENRLSIYDFKKHVPPELYHNKHRLFQIMFNSKKNFNQVTVTRKALSCFRYLELGRPIVPDLHKILDNMLMELCLPDHFKNLVSSLIQLEPCNHLDGDPKFFRNMQDFEVTIMSYILVALKMCFGLDGQYEFQLSDAVDKVNEDNRFPKYHKICPDAEARNRLFSFRDWCTYLHVRRFVLSKHYLHITSKTNQDFDDYLCEESINKHPMLSKIRLSDQVLTDIINKIPATKDVTVIPESEFCPTLTPFTTYSDVVVNYIQDYELKLILTEDFSQYSLKYACEDLKLPSEESDNIVIGVNEANKKISPQHLVESLLATTEHDSKTMVYVRNCDNKNWMVTKPPTASHIFINQDKNRNSSSKDIDHGYDSNVENTNIENETAKKTDEEIDDKFKIYRTCQVIKEEDADKNIFDDLFDTVVDNTAENYENESKDIIESNPEQEYLECNSDDEKDSDIQNSKDDIVDNRSKVASLFSAPKFDPKTFNKAEIIKQLAILTCKKYKITLPYKFGPPATERKRNRETLKKAHEIVEENDAKRRKIQDRKAGKEVVDNLIHLYNEHFERDILNQISAQVREAIRNVQQSGAGPDSNNTVDGTGNDMLPDIGTDEPVALDFFDNTKNDSDRGCMISDEDSENELIPKPTPEFDPKTHDIQQLYIKIENNDDESDSEKEVEFEDAEVEKLILHKAENTEDIKNKTVVSESDSEDDLPLSEIQKFKKSLRVSNSKARELEPLIVNPQHVRQFKYWYRHYFGAMYTDYNRRHLLLRNLFHQELHQNFPRSFMFVLGECADILKCNSFYLYKHMEHLEIRLKPHIK